MEASGGDPVVVKACEAYAGPLYSYCLWLLADEEQAIAALVELFVGAQRLGTRLDDPRLSRWLLYAMVRSPCLAARGEEDRPWLRDVADSFAWTDGLDWEQREVLELSVRHGLDEQDIALVLGVSHDAARTRLADARTSLETARAVRTLVPSGCDELSEQLAAVSPQGLGAVVQGHAAQCLTCGERLRDAPATPARLAQVPTPPTLRLQILHALADNNPALAEPVAKAISAHTPPTPQRQSEQPQSQSQPARGRRAAMTAALVIIPVGVAALLLTAGGNTEHPSSGPVMTGAGPTGAGTTVASNDGSTAASAGVVSKSGASPSRGGVTASATASTTARTFPTGTSPSPGSSGSAVATPSPAPSTVPSSGPSLGVTWSQDRQTTTITLTATGGGPVQWSVSVSDSFLNVSQPTGALAPGQSQTVTVTVDPSFAPHGPWHAKIFVEPGHTVIPVNGSGNGNGNG